MYCGAVQHRRYRNSRRPRVNAPELTQSATYVHYHIITFLLGCYTPTYGGCGVLMPLYTVNILWENRGCGFIFKFVVPAIY